MNFIDALTAKYFDFHGKTSRKDFWLYMLFLIIVNTVSILILGAICAFNYIGIDETVYRHGITEFIYGIYAVGGLFTCCSFIFMVWYIYTIIPTLAITVRRLHDVGRSGWWVAAYIISIILFSLSIEPVLFSILSSAVSLIVLIFCLLKGKDITQ